VTTQRSPSLSLRVGARQFGRGVTGTLNPLQLAEQSVNTSKANNILAALGEAQAGAAGLGRYLTQGKLDQERKEAEDRRVKAELSREWRNHQALTAAQNAEDVARAKELGLEHTGGALPELMTQEEEDAFYRAHGSKSAERISSLIDAAINRGEVDVDFGNPDAVADFIAGYLVPLKKPDGSDMPGSEQTNKQIKKKLIDSLARKAGATRTLAVLKLRQDATQEHLAGLGSALNRYDLPDATSAINDLVTIGTGAGATKKTIYTAIHPYLLSLAEKPVEAKPWFPDVFGDRFVGEGDPARVVEGMKGNKFFYEVLDSLPDDYEALMPKEYMDLVHAAVLAERGLINNTLTNDLYDDFRAAKSIEERAAIRKHYETIINIRAGFPKDDPRHMPSSTRITTLNEILRITQDEQDAADVDGAYR
jgi:hypothetical protein